jgi:hypothetical protein
VFSTICIVVLAVIAIGLFVARSRVTVPEVSDQGSGYSRERAKREADDAKGVRLGLLIAGWLTVAGAVIWLLVATITIVGANEVGVPVTFGKIGTPLQSGPHVTAPWTDVETLPTRPRTFEVDATVRTNESGRVTIRLAGRWATDRNQAGNLYTQARTGDEERIQRELISPNLASAAGEFYGGLNNYDAVTGEKWQANAAGVEAVAVKTLAKYGIDLDSVKIRSTAPDEATEKNIAAFSAQQRATNIAIAGQATATEEAERRRIEALGLKTAAAQIPSLSPTQFDLLCLQAAERIAAGNQAKGLPTYALPCSAGAAAVIAK